MPEISRFYGIAVTAAEYIEDYKLCLTFNNGAVRVVDFCSFDAKRDLQEIAG